MALCQAKLELKFNPSGLVANWSVIYDDGARHLWSERGEGERKQERDREK
jgi:hypothetical protein